MRNPPTLRGGPVARAGNMNPRSGLLSAKMAIMTSEQQPESSALRARGSSVSSALRASGSSVSSALRASGSSVLAELASRYRVATQYEDANGRQVVVGDQTLVD